MRDLRSFLALVALVALFGPATVPTGILAQDPPASLRANPPAVIEPEAIPDRHHQWLLEVQPLITHRERALFLALTRDHQREAFIQEFWKVRDPYPRTGRNELKEKWPIRVAEAKDRFGSLADDRSRIYLVHGKPDGYFAIECSGNWSPVEIWGYRRSDWVDFRFVLVFFRARPEMPFRVWRLGDGGFVFDELLERTRSCRLGNRLGSLIKELLKDSEGYRAVLAQVLARPRPTSEEWVDAFVALSTDLPAEAEALEVDLQLAFLGRNQTRTVVHGILQIPSDVPERSELAGYHSYDFQLTGEVLAEGTLFEGFRYRFGFPADDAPNPIPLAFQRFLRPGDYSLILRLDDLNSSKVWRRELPLHVPLVEELWTPEPSDDPRTSRLFEEATAALEAGETSIRIIDPQIGLLTGPVRFDTLVTGEEIQKVQFLLDGRAVLTRTRPPFSVEIDLGSFPDLRLLEARALDSEEREIAADELLVNGGGHRFAVDLAEPRSGERYTQSLRVRAEVLVPEGRSLERLDLFLDERKVATLYQEPFVHPVVLPATAEVATVRAVAYLLDGHSTEDTVFINAPDYLDEVDIQFVELFTTVLDRQDRPVQGLDRGNFTVLEDGVPQSIVRFDRVLDQPIHVGVVLDNSASMVATLSEVRGAALRFFESAIRPRDRAAVITFNNFPRLAVELTNDRAALGRALAGLVPEGRTALYDSLMFAMYYFTGVKGQRALLVLSDGKDEASRFDFEQTLNYARRAGITLYSVGLRVFDPRARRHLDLLAEQTGGRSFHLREVGDLDAVYDTIQKELRSQYLIAYQSSNVDESDGFRTVEVRTDEDHTVKTMSGYYP